MEEVGAKTLRLARRLERAENRRHLLESNAKLEPRELGAEAQVGVPQAESEVAVRLPNLYLMKSTGRLAELTNGRDNAES